MKTIKKLGKEYCKPSTNIVDWNKVVGKRCVIDQNPVDGSERFVECTIEDFEPESGLLKVSTSEKAEWLSKRKYNGWILVFVYDDELPKTSALSKEVQLLLEATKKREVENKAKAREPNPKDIYLNPPPYYVPKLPPFPDVWKCSKCELSFNSNDPIGYVCPNNQCPSGLGFPMLTRTNIEGPVGTDYAD